MFAKRSKVSRLHAAPMVLAVLLGTLVVVGGSDPAAAVNSNQFAWPVSGHTDAGEIAWHQANEAGTRAVDIQAPLGTDVHAAQSGVVEEVHASCPNTQQNGCDHGLGNYVVIRHDRTGVNNPLRTAYAHLNNSIPVTVGAQVSTGQKIGDVAQSGTSYGPHVHFLISNCSGVMWGSACTVWSGSDTSSANVSAGAAVPGTYAQLVGVTTTFSEGQYVQISATGALYRIAGGSPMRVMSLGNVPWTGNYVTTTQSVIDSLPMYPADGTVIRNYGSGAVYVVAGGFAFSVTSLGNIPNPNYIDVDGWSITNQLRSLPADGTVIRNYGSSAVYVVSGGAPVPVMSMGNIPYANYTNIDGWGITNQLSQYPANGSVVVANSTGAVYVIAGGAAMPVNSFDNIPPVTSMAYIDNWAIANHFQAYPADGTLVRNYGTGAIHVVAGGMPLAIASLSNVPYTGGWVNVDGASITPMRTMPVDGTFLKGYVSGRIYKIVDQEPMYIGDINQVTGTPIVVDDWALQNQLGLSW